MLKLNRETLKHLDASAQPIQGDYWDMDAIAGHHVLHICEDGFLLTED